MDATIGFIANIVYLIIGYFLTRLIGLVGMIIAFLIQVILIIFFKYNYIERRLYNE